MKKYFITKLINSYIDMLKSPAVLDDYCSYYSAIINWVKDNKKYINEDLFKKSRLDILINLDPNIYIIDEPEIPLSMVIERFKRINPHNINSLAMIIGDTLWELVTIRTGKNCPICKDAELKFIIAEIVTTQEQKLILECETCIWSEYVSGEEWSYGYAKIIPASKKDLEKFGVKI